MRLVQQLVAQSTVEAFEKCTLLQLAGLDVAPVAPADLAAFEDRHACDFGAVVGDACQWLGSPPRDYSV